VWLRRRELDCQSLPGPLLLGDLTSDNMARVSASSAVLDASASLRAIKAISNDSESDPEADCEIAGGGVSCLLAN
jgi:hypothetical protein